MVAANRANTSRRCRTGRSSFVLFIRAFGRSQIAVVGLGVVVAWTVIAIGAPSIAPHQPLAQDLRARLVPPSPAHWFGTDQLGRDILSRVLYGARLSLPVGIAAVILAIILGMSVGATAGFLGGVID